MTSLCVFSGKLVSPEVSTQSNASRLYAVSKAFASPERMAYIVSLSQPKLLAF